MTETAETTETAAASGAGGAPAAQVIEASELWVRVQRAAGNRLTSIMEELRLETADQGAAVLVGPAAVVAMARANTAAIEDLFARAGGRPIKVEVRVEMRAEPGPVGAAPPVSESEPPPVNLNEHPLVKQAVELFGVKTPIRVMLRRKGEGSS